MNQFLVNYRSSYVLPFSLLILGVVMVYIDSKISGKQLSNMDYIKISLVIVLSSGIVVYAQGLKGAVDEEVLSGPTPF